MKKIFKRNFVRNDNKVLMLFGYNEHTEDSKVEIEIENQLFLQ